MDELLKRSQGAYVSPLHFADIYLGTRGSALSPQPLGDYDRAFEYFDSAVADRNGFLGALVVDSVYDPIRADPRFVALFEWSRTERPDRAPHLPYH